MTALEVIRQRFSAQSKGKRPTVLPAMSRNHLPAFCKELGFTRGAEIGVWKGAYSATFCEANPAMHMLCVDPWVSYPAWLDTKNKLDPVEAAKDMADAEAIALLRLHPLNATIVKQFSVDASADVPDGSLDFVYIDGNHVCDAVVADLVFWAPKVRAGGIVAGHDYRDFPHKPFVQVIQAVNHYTLTHQIRRWFTTAADRTPSFLWMVP